MLATPGFPASLLRGPMTLTTRDRHCRFFRAYGVFRRHETDRRTRQDVRPLHTRYLLDAASGNKQVVNEDATNV